MLCAVRREWPLALVLAGTLAFLLGHGFLLLPMARHALPAWTVWYLALAYVLGTPWLRAPRSAPQRSPAAREPRFTPPSAPGA